MFNARALGAFAAALLLAGAAGWAEERIEFDFERGPLDAQWEAIGPKLMASRQPVVAAPAKGGPAGSGLNLSAVAAGGAFTKEGVLPADLSKFDRLEFWVHRSEDEARTRPQVDIEARVTGKDGGRFWRRVPLEGAGWQKVSLPLHWFRWGQGRLPDWEHVDRLGVWLRGPSDLQIDGLALVDDDAERGAALAPADVIDLAFKVSPREVRKGASPHAVVAGDAPELDAKQLAEHLEQVAKALDDELPEFSEGPPAVLLVFANDDDYRAFTPRLGERLGAEAPAPQSDGYTLHGVATAAWNPRYGTLRPVYTHEFVHAYLIPRLGYDNHGDWLHEGLAARTQLRFHPQPGFEKIVQQGLADPAARSPLEHLANGRPIPVQRYWQAATLVDMLFASPKYAPHRAALLAAIRKAGSAALGPHLRSVLETDWAELETDWKQWCAAKYGVAN